MFDLLDTVCRLLSFYAPSTRENDLAVHIAELAREHADVSVDRMGNILAAKPGKNDNKLLLCAPMDSLGYAVTHTEGGGFYRFGCLTPAKTSAFCRPGQTVSVRDRVGIIAAGKGYDPLSPHPDDLLLDFGPEADISVGDIGAPEPRVWNRNGVICSSSLSRVGCALLLQVLAEVQPHDSLLCLFTVRRELDSRGARNIALRLNPDQIVSIELSACRDIPGGEGVPALGCGPVLRVIDGSYACRPEILSRLSAAADCSGVTLQSEIVFGGSVSEAAVLSTYGGGAPGGVLGVPARYTDTASPLCCLSDLSAAGTVLRALAENAQPG